MIFHPKTIAAKAFVLAFFVIAPSVFGAGSQGNMQNIAQEVSGGIQHTSIRKGSSLAIVNIDNTTEDSASNIISTLETALIKSGYIKLISRRLIAEAKNEINFGFSEYIDDLSAARVGHFLGANYIMVGNITNNILVLQILEVETLQIIYSEQFDISFLNDSTKSRGFRF